MSGWGRVTDGSGYNGFAMLWSATKMKTALCLCVLAFSSLCFGQQKGSFNLVADYRDIGGLNGTIVGPGPTPGSERLYAAYTYFENTFEVLSIDPATGDTTVFANPIPGEWATFGMAIGPDGCIYMGTAPTAHFVKLDPKRGTLVDLGRPATTEQWIFDVAFGSDERLYGVTFPNAKMVRYSPKTGALEDMGRLDPKEQYARYVVSSKDGFIYVAIGTNHSNVAVYQIATMERKEILPPDAQTPGTLKVFTGQDGNVYARNGSRLFRIDHWTATEITTKTNSPAERAVALRDSRAPTLVASQGTLKMSLGQGNEREIRYRSQRLPLYRIGFGPDGELYGSSVTPIHLVRVDAGSRVVKSLGELGAGEIYSFLSRNDRLWMGAYAGLSALMSYKPGNAFNPGTGSGNPTLINPKGIATSWRPMDMVEGPDKAIYVAATAPYGQLESGLLKFVPETGASEQFAVVHDQSVNSLALWHDRIVGGTTVKGGGGSNPTQTSASLFTWDPATGQKTFETVPVPGKGSILDLIVAPDDHVFGIADDTLFEFDPKKNTVVSRQPVPFTKAIYNSVGLDSAGNIWGLAKEGIFTINTRTGKIQLIAPAPEEITGGFAMRGGKIYFISKSAVYSYTM